MRVENFTPLQPDFQGWNGNSPVYYELVAETHPTTILEIGSWKGQSTNSLAKACIKKGLTTKIYCIDTWLGALEFIENERLYGSQWDRMLIHGYPSVYYQFLSNMIHNDILEMIEPIPSTSENAVPYVPNAELIYIDGQHTYKGVKEDLNNYWPKLKKGGIMFGDDYYLMTADVREVDGYRPEVKRAVDEFVEERRLTLEVLYNNFWVIRNGQKQL